MPVENFNELFTTWPENDTLSVKDLRLKAITLLALTLMLRPSDIAPNNILFDDISGHTLKQNFTMKNIVFEKDCMKVTFFGIKNDALRKGFEVLLPKSKSVKIDPVQTLYDYIERTRGHGSGRPCVHFVKIPLQCNWFLNGIYETRRGYSLGRAIH